MTRRRRAAAWRWPRLDPKLLGLGALGLALLAAFLLWPRGESGAPPGSADLAGRLEARPALVDLGRVPFDRVAEARFELVNSGGQPVRLLEKPAVRVLEGC